MVTKIVSIRFINYTPSGFRPFSASINDFTFCIKSSISEFGTFLSCNMPFSCPKYPMLVDGSYPYVNNPNRVRPSISIWPIY